MPCYCGVALFSSMPPVNRHATTTPVRTRLAATRIRTAARIASRPARSAPAGIRRTTLPLPASEPQPSTSADVTPPPPAAPVIVGPAVAIQADQISTIVQQVIAAMSTQPTPPPPGEFALPPTSPTLPHVTPFPEDSFHDLEPRSPFLLPPSLPSHSDSLTTPIDLLVPDKLKAKIWNNTYFEFSELFQPSSDDSDAFSMELQNNQLVMVPRKSKPISSIEAWTSAFLRFVAVRCQKYPHEVQSLMKYGEIVRNLAKPPNPPSTWRSYDKKFRSLRQTSFIEWDTLHSEFYILSSLSAQSAPTHHAPPRFASRRNHPFQRPPPSGGGPIVRILPISSGLLPHFQPQWLLQQPLL